MSINSQPPADDLPAAGREEARRRAGDEVAAGRWAEAAALLRAAGDPVAAARLYERIWDFRAAAACAREAGDLTGALRYAIDARDEPQIAELVAGLDAGGEAGRRVALDVLVSRRRPGEAAQLAERLGERERAIELYRDAHRLLDAARLLEDAGQDREAGLLYERVLERTGADEAATAQLRLGLLLARRLQHEEAARHLQAAAREEATRAAARPALVVELVALGLRDAARSVLAAARADDPTLPEDVDELLRRRQAERPPAPADRESRLVGGRYRLERLLGAGAAGRVFRARDEVTARQVAVKVLAHANPRGRDGFERFLREARIAGSLRHPNVVEIVDVSVDGGYLVMEYLEGGSLADRLRPSLPGPAVRRAALDVLAGLEAAHQRGIVHRDVKPANIVFDARGAAKLGDFGVAHLLDLGQTQTGGLIGTLAYMSPEQITGAPLSFAADLYGLGVTLFHALTGRLPFLGPDFVAQHLGEPAPAASAVSAEVAPAWDAPLARLLAKDPAARHETIEALRRELGALDLGEAAHASALALLRAGGRARRESLPPPSDGGAEAAAAPPRYQYETPIGRTDNATLGRAVDRALDRSVVVERFDEGAPDPITERRLRGLARGGGPYVQRALSYDRAARVAVYEAPAGRPVGEAYTDEPPGPREAARLLKRLARALAPMHEAGIAHGALDGAHVLIDEEQTPTVLTGGLGPAPADASPAADVAAVIALVAEVARVQPGTAEGLVAVLARHLSPPERAAVLALSTARDAEDLYRFADALEIAILKGAFAGRLDRF